jgi:hypothetical protein
VESGEDGATQVLAACSSKFNAQSVRETLRAHSEKLTDNQNGGWEQNIKALQRLGVEGGILRTVGRVGNHCLESARWGPRQTDKV